MKSITILTVGEDQLSDEVIKTLADWVQFGMISDLLISQKGREGVGSCESWPGETQRPLEMLAKHHYDRIRVAALYLCLEGGEVRGDLNGARDLFRQIRDNSPSNIEISFLNIAVPVTGASGVRKDQVFSTQASANVVMSPEDRPSAARVNQEVHLETNLIAHAALGAVTACGLWAGQESGPFDDHQAMALDDGGPGAYLMRGYGRALFGGRLADRIVDGTMTLRDFSSWPIPDPSTHSQALRPEATVHRSAQQFIGWHRRDLELRAPESGPMERKRAVSITEALAHLGTYFLSFFRALPGETATGIYDYFRPKIERMAQGLTYGTDSKYVVTLGGKAVRTDLPTASSVSLADIDMAIAQIIETADHPLIVDDRRLLSQMRETAFALIDGTESQLALEPEGKTKPLVTDPALIAPVPYDSISARPSTVGADEWADWVTAAADPANDLRVPRSDVRELEAILERLRASAAGAASSETANGGGEEIDDGPEGMLLDPDRNQIGGPSPEPPPAHPEPPASQEDEGTAEVGAARGIEGDDITAVEERVRGALDSVRRTFTGRIAWHVHTQLTDTLRRLRDTIEQARALDVSEDELNKTRRNLERARIALIVGLLAIPTVSMLVPFALLITLPIGIATWMIGVVLYGWRVFRFSNRLREPEEKGEKLVRHAEHYAGEARRLRIQYERITRWVEIISGFAYSPWGTARLSADDERAQLTRQPPLAVQLAEATINDERIRFAIRHARQRLFKAGWLGSVYDAYLRGFSSQFVGVEKSVTPDQILFDDPTGWQEFTLYTRAPRVIDEIRAGAVERVIEASNELELDELFQLDLTTASAETTGSDDPDAFLVDIIPTGASPDRHLAPIVWAETYVAIGDPDLVSSKLIGPARFRERLGDTEYATATQQLSAGKAYLNVVARVDASPMQRPEHLAPFEAVRVVEKAPKRATSKPKDTNPDDF